jgi:hypothetical protein
MWTFVAVLVAVGALVVAPQPAAADCLYCDQFSDCVADISLGFACSCTIRVIGGRTFCRPDDFTCALDGDCSGDPPPDEQLQSEVSNFSLVAFEARDPLLAQLLQANVKMGANRHAYLSVKSYSGGSIHGPDGDFSHAGLFSMKKSGVVVFRFDVVSRKDGVTTTYTGSLSNHAKAISYSKVVRTPAMAEIAHDKADWTVPN